MAHRSGSSLGSVAFNERRSHLLLSLCGYLVFSLQGALEDTSLSGDRFRHSIALGHWALGVEELFGL